MFAAGARWLTMEKTKVLVGLASACIVLLLPGVLAAEVDPATRPDVRVVIDISGSMKQNDPHNLRIPALNMLIGLLPEGAKAGVWTFAEQVNMLVPHAEVDAQWKNMAKLQTGRINSVGLYTDIGGALEEAGFDLAQEAPGYRRSIILLTDGMVDIDRDPQVNLAERTRVLEQILPRIMAAHVPVHSIALSKKADADAMRQISLSTGGFFAIAESAEDLAKIFLQAFDQSAPSEQVPLDDNRFLIDSSIEEFTLLAFRKEDSDATILKSPAGVSFQITDYPGHVKWFADRGFDLITVKQPLEGEWILAAENVPENRVTIVSNLKLMVSDLPVNTYPGGKLNLEVYFQEEGNVIVDPDLLKLLDVQIVVTFPDGSKKAKTLSSLESVPEDGVYKTPLKIFKERGKYNVLISVDGKTFIRERFQDVYLRDPVSVEILEEVAVVRIRPISQLIDVQETNVLARVKKPDGKSVISSLSLNEAGYWDLDLSPFTDAGQYRLLLDVEGKTLRGQVFKLTLDPLTIQYPPSPSVADEPVVDEPYKESVVAEAQIEDVADSENQLPEPPPDLVEEIIPESSTLQELQQDAAVEDTGAWNRLLANPLFVDSILYGTMVLLGGLILFGLGYWYYRKKGALEQKSTSEGLDEQQAVDLDSRFAEQDSPQSADPISSEVETILREAEGSDAVADAKTSEAELDTLDSSADEQDLDEFLAEISIDLEEDTQLAENAAPDPEIEVAEQDDADQVSAESDDDLAALVDEGEMTNNKSKFPGDRSLVMDESAVDDIVEQNRPAGSSPAGSGPAPNPPS